MSLNCSDCPHSLLVHTEGPTAKCKECDCSLIKAPVRKQSVSKPTRVLTQHTEPVYVPGMGNPNAKLLICGEAPGKHEEDEGRPFCGPSGKLLDEFLRNAGLPREEVYTTNVVKHRPPNNDLKRLSEIGKKVEDYLPQLWEEINTINPNVIIAVGGLSLKVLTGNEGITKWRGSILRTLDSKRKVVPTIHPANLLPNSPSMLPYSTRAYIQLDFNRAVEESRTNNYDVPRRVLFVCKSSEQLQNFLRQNNSGLYSIDIETYKSIPTCIAIAPNRHCAISVPLVRQSSKWDKVEIPDYEIEEIWRIISEFLGDERNKIIGQNFKFDQERLLNTCHMQIGNFYADTLLMAHTLQPEFPKGLYFLTSVYTREPYYKDEGKEFNPGKDKLERLFLYNAKDAVVTFEVYEELRKELEEVNLWEFYTSHVHPQHNLYFDIEDIGFAFNETRRKELQIVYTQKAAELQEELNNLAGHTVNVNSPKQVKELLYGELRFPERKDASEDTIVALLANHAKSEPDANRIPSIILDLRRIKKTIGTYLNSLTDYDGRMRSSYRIVGTENGRSSSSKYGPPTRPENIGIAAQTVTEHGDFGTEFQECFVASDGYILLSADLSQAEARVVAILANDMELLEKFNTTDIHKLTSSWLFGITPESVTKEMRFIGKMARHGGNYDMKKRRLMTEIMTNARRFHIDVTVSEYKAGQILDTFHSYTPKIRGIFHEEIKRVLSNTRTLVNPYGRRRQFFDRWGEDLWKEAYACIPQGTVKDKLATAMLAIKKERSDTRFLRESHDAFVLECRVSDEKEYRQLVEYELTKPIDFGRCSLPRGLLTIPCEIKVGYNLGSMS